MSRPLGLLAMVRRTQEEVIAALDANTGATIWEHRYASPTSGVDFSEGAGPHATPLVTADRVFAAGSRKEIFALNKANGQVVWSHDLIKEYGATPPDRGYACSPLFYNGTIIVSVGGPGQTLAAFHEKTGALVWKTGDLQDLPGVADDHRRRRPEAAPLLRRRRDPRAGSGDREDALDPPAQDRLGPQHQHADLVAVGSPAVCLVRLRHRQPRDRAAPGRRQDDRGGKVVQQPDARAHRHGDPRRHAVYGSSGDFGPSFLTAVDVTTGKIAWQDRGFARAQLLYADGKLVILDEDGTLGICDRHARGPAGAREGVRPREHRVDASDARRYEALRPRPEEHRGVRTGTVDSFRLPLPASSFRLPAVRSEREAGSGKREAGTPTSP